MNNQLQRERLLILPIYVKIIFYTISLNIYEYTNVVWSVEYVNI